MSKYDKCAYRYPDDCPFDCCKVPREKHVPGMSHAFVEPVSAPQPPADATLTVQASQETVAYAFAGHGVVEMTDDEADLICECGSGVRLHVFGGHESCEYFEHHCDTCHEAGICTAHVKVLSKLLRMVPLPGVPTAPPVSGDGDEACLEIATEVATEDWDTRGCPDSLEWVIGCALAAAQKAYAAGIARGRALGARDAVRPEVSAFAQLMEQQLRANDGKGGWKDEGTAYLSRRCGDELEELRAAIQRQHREWMQGFPPVDAEKRETLKADVGREAADVANFAMMIADVCGALEARRAGREGK